MGASTPKSRPAGTLLEELVVEKAALEVEEKEETNLKGSSLALEEQPTVMKSDEEGEEEDLGSTAVEEVDKAALGVEEEEETNLMGSSCSATVTLSLPLFSPMGSLLAAPADPLLGSLSPASLSWSGCTVTPPRSITLTL